MYNKNLVPDEVRMRQGSGAYLKHSPYNYNNSEEPASVSSGYNYPRQSQVVLGQSNDYYKNAQNSQNNGLTNSISEELKKFEELEKRGNLSESLNNDLKLIELMEKGNRAVNPHVTDKGKIVPYKKAGRKQKDFPNIIQEEAYPEKYCKCPTCGTCSTF